MMTGLTRYTGNTLASRPQTTRWDPWSEFSRIRQEMDSLFGNFLGAAPRAVEGIAWTPPVDLYETADDLVLNAYLPGMSREDIHVEVVGNSIRLSGQSKANVPDSATHVHFTHGGFGQFEIAYNLPVEVEAGNVSATYRNGILELRMPKAEAAKPKTIEVQVGG